ncbi:MAG: type II toxin-antitoxin system HicA family toxin [Candidatus Manganitrophus sp.]|nr:type II toxin-antitoxin system HicA family toxin [Candidatus Manganitrophus sp.]MDC4227792.1 type II toxin-antitoxin system HicA family toxin [Candidatus Manganitrophus sp.]WDT70886.1 MAG: type II toxin-antitoxin system HicA family toxin [Candidatus Manganitrophus sp.]WDT81844.1 MAG: type II toxin-antitoxin system HicA family toxin [Candidatus Manganitrophus sp.]
MPKLKRLSGDEVVAIFAHFGFAIHAQRGSHVKLRRTGPSGRQSLTVPKHRELDSGTLRAIIRQASRFIPEEQLHPHFYS